MAKPNYSYQKYLREQKKKKKREEKRKSKQAKKNSLPGPDTKDDNIKDPGENKQE